MQSTSDRQKPPRLVLIAAMSRNRVISAQGKIPWSLPRDTSHFRARAAGQWLLLGRRTYEQMRGWFQPGQVPLVLTSHPARLSVPGGFACASLKAALALAEAHALSELLVSGGGSVYTAALPLAREVILTTVEADFEGDVFFPEFPCADWNLEAQTCFPADQDNFFGMSIARWRRDL